MYQQSTPLFETSTEISGKIEVIEFPGIRELIINGTLQTMWSDDARIMKNTYWEAMSQVNLKNENADITILGLGGGTVAKWYSIKFPSSKIKCVEIDEEVIKIAHKYFQIDLYPNISTIHDDAYTWIARQEDASCDVICCDTFISDKFILDNKNDSIKKISSILKPSGVFVTNRIYEEEYINDADDYIRSLADSFSTIQTKTVSRYTYANNIIIFASN